MLGKSRRGEPAAHGCRSPGARRRWASPRAVSGASGAPITLSRLPEPENFRHFSAKTCRFWQVHYAAKSNMPGQSAVCAAGGKEIAVIRRRRVYFRHGPLIGKTHAPELRKIQAHQKAGARCQRHGVSGGRPVFRRQRRAQGVRSGTDHGDQPGPEAAQAVPHRGFAGGQARASAHRGHPRRRRRRGCRLHCPGVRIRRRLVAVRSARNAAAAGPGDRDGLQGPAAPSTTLSARASSIAT
jgi:hypothetical protein